MAGVILHMGIAILHTFVTLETHMICLGIFGKIRPDRLSRYDEN
jgi:hypothetical protein